MTSLPGRAQPFRHRADRTELGFTSRAQIAAWIIRRPDEYISQ